MKMFPKRKFYVRMAKVGVLSVAVFAVYFFSSRDDGTKHDNGIEANHRHLLTLTDNSPNCTPRAVEQFPRDIFTTEQRRKGAIVVHVSVAVYMFLGFALLCDDYFVPSLEVLCKVLHIQPDVAGATFMAAGSSAPELATSVIAVFIAKDDIGVGTVVGSAVYNVMFVISICALCAPKVVPLNWWPLFRDCIFYTISVLALAIVIVDEEVYWYEAISFIILYMLYILLMYFNKPLEAWIAPKFVCCRAKGQAGETDTIVLVQRHSENGIASNGNGKYPKDKTSNGQAGDRERCEFEDDERDQSDTEPLMGNHDEIEFQLEEPVEKSEVFQFPEVLWKRIIWLIALPLKVLFFISIPDCRLERWKKYFIVTFCMSLVWLSVLSYLMVWMITIVGYTAGIADTIMGLTFIAFGVSLPDVITSLIVIREGQGDMAVSNAVGSNVFDILICLGVPWMLQTIIKSGAPVQVYSRGLWYATLTLLITVLFLLSSIHINGWRLTKRYGVILMVVYAFFTILTSLYELNVFGYVHPKECESSY